MSNNNNTNHNTSQHDSNSSSGDELKRSMHEIARDKFLTFAEKWAKLILTHIKAPIVRVLVATSRHAAAHPKTYVVGTISFSIILLVIGLATNFSTEVDEDNAWTPTGSRSLSHGKWIADESGFPEDPRYMLFQLHKDGGNVLEEAHLGVSKVFEAVDLVRRTPGYAELCSQYSHPEDDPETGDPTCPIYSVRAFWNNSLSVFETNETLDDAAVIEALSATVYPNDEPVDRQLILGYARQVDPLAENGLLESAKSYSVTFSLPPIDDLADEVEKDAIDELLLLRDAWEDDPDNPFHLEVMAYRSFGDEFMRAIVRDLPLLPAVFVVMAILCCVVFSNRDRVQSRSILGFGATITVLLALMTGFGLLFLCGVPFSFLTQILPFIIFGIGLDNCFLIFGSYGRTDPSKDSTERIEETMKDVGSTITLTTMTTCLAFGLGCMSDIPAIYWLCIYAFPTIAIDYIYQVTFFVALVALDDRRIRQNRKDYCCCCCSNNSGPRVDEGSNEQSLKPHIAERAMVWFADFLLQTRVKQVVVLGFIALTAGCAYSTTKLEQQFKFVDLMPSDSYVASFWNVFQTYYERSGVRPAAYFRFVDQSDQTVQDDMRTFVNELVDLEQISSPPVFFWLDDFDEFKKDPDVLNEPFNVQIAAFLNHSVYGQLYSENMVIRDGELVESRTFLEMDQVNQDVVLEQTDALQDQRDVAARQEINQGRGDWAFFTYDGAYYIWEFYNVAVQELIQTTIIGVCAVTAVAMIAIPHWTSFLFISPLICILYIDLLGVVQFAGLYVNSITYIGMVMSIGLIVDYTYHILLRYVETPGNNREARVKEALRTIGSSVLMGGFSTLLGVVPLAFSTSEIIRTVFVVFIALVALGLSHGLILLPVILSVIGPLNKLPDVSDRQETKEVGQKAAPEPTVKEKTESAMNVGDGLEEITI